jgi:hypothetical protein
MLSQEELLAFSGTPGELLQLTQTAVRRLFEEYITYRPMEMDYRTFLDLVLALENKLTVESMSYFFRILDIDKCGRLTPASIRYFYKDIHETLKSTKYDAPPVANMVVEVFDILSCNDPRGPTFQELVSSGQGHTVISMLLDVNGFWVYDNRESLMQQNQNNTEQQQQQQQQQQQAAPAAAAVDTTRSSSSSGFGSSTNTTAASTSPPGSSSSSSSGSSSLSPTRGHSTIEGTSIAHAKSGSDVIPVSTFGSGSGSGSGGGSNTASGASGGGSNGNGNDNGSGGKWKYDNAKDDYYDNYDYDFD